jgi:peptide/nickel transport system permease protein
MLQFIIRRVLYTLPLLFFVSLLIFALMQAQPGDYVDALCGTEGCGGPSSPLRDQLRERYGIDEPFHIQYVKWVTRVACCLDFGYSFATQSPAWWTLVAENRWLYTFALIISSMVISWFLGISIGVYSATHRYSLGDKAFTFFGFLGISIPHFIFSLLFIYFMVSVIGIGNIDQFFMIGGLLNPEYVNKPLSLISFLNFLWHFIPPVLILAAGSTAIIIRYMRGSILDILGMDYISTARAKGLKERWVIYKHTLRNAINPMITMLGFWIPMTLEGALVVSILFNLPQIEKTFFDSIENRDTAVTTTGLVIFSAILIVGNLVSDILLALSDPRIRYD